MRRLMAMIATILLAGSTTTSWALAGLENVSFDGSLEVSAVSAANEEDLNDGARPSDRHSDVDTRVRVGMNLDVTEGVKGRLEFTRSGRRYGSGATNITSEENRIEVQNAYIALQNFLALGTVRLGRQYVGREGDLVWNISPRSDDILSVDAVDGVYFGRDWDRLGFNAFLGKAQDLNTQGNADDDFERSIKNFELMFMLSEMARLHAGVIMGSNRNNLTTQGPTRLKIYRVGANGALSENMFTYRAEYLMNDGEDRQTLGSKVDFEGNAIDLGVGVNLPESSLGSLGFGANYLMASGDDNTADTKDESFRDLRAVGVLSSDRYYGEIFGRSNVLGGASTVPLGLGVDSGAQGTGAEILHLNALYKPAFAPKAWGRIDFYDFAANETQNDGDYGTEIDLTVGYRHSDNVGLEAGYATLSPDDQLVAVANGPDDDITKWFGRLKVRWGGGMTQID